MIIEVKAATPDETPILANLLQLYAHDFSEFQEIELGPDGRFDYKPLPLYWSDPNRRPFLVRIDGKLAGLVLIASNESVWDMTEFFILRAYRKRGIGTDVAHDVWRRFPGTWEVRVMESNHAALRFWDRAISMFAGQPMTSTTVEKGAKRWQVFSFVA